MGTESAEYWAILRLSGTVLGLSFSVLLWYSTHFLSTLKSAEAKSPETRQALEVSPRILALLGIIGFILITTVLTGLMITAASRSGAAIINPRKPGSWLLLLFVGAPSLGALVVGCVVVQQIGGAAGIGKVISSLKLPFRKPVMLKPVRTEMGTPRKIPNLKGNAKWDASLEWVRRNESHWNLGRGFTRANKGALTSLAYHCWATLLEDVGPDEARALVENRLAHEIDLRLEGLGATRARILNRPLQIARGSLAMLVSEGDP